jgi:hypothetical protein
MLGVRPFDIAQDKSGFFEKPGVRSRRFTTVSFILSSPKRLKALVAAAAVAVDFVADGVLLLVVLVIVFGRIEFRRANDFGDDGLLEATLETLL